MHTHIYRRKYVNGSLYSEGHQQFVNRRGGGFLCSFRTQILLERLRIGSWINRQARWRERMARWKGREQWTRRVQTRQLGIREAASDADAVRKTGAVCEGREYARHAARQREIPLSLVCFVFESLVKPYFLIICRKLFSLSTVRRKKLLLCSFFLILSAGRNAAQNFQIVFTQFSWTVKTCKFSFLIRLHGFRSKIA
jgi:hypothetical protein